MRVAQRPWEENENFTYFELFGKQEEVLSALNTLENNPEFEGLGTGFRRIFPIPFQLSRSPPQPVPVVEPTRELPRGVRPSLPGIAASRLDSLPDGTPRKRGLDLVDEYLAGRNEWVNRGGAPHDYKPACDFCQTHSHLSGIEHCRHWKFEEKHPGGALILEDDVTPPGGAKCLPCTQPFLLPYTVVNTFSSSQSGPSSFQSYGRNPLAKSNIDFDRYMLDHLGKMLRRVYKWCTRRLGDLDRGEEWEKRLKSSDLSGSASDHSDPSWCITAIRILLCDSEKFATCLFGSKASADVGDAFRELKTMRNDLFHGANLDPEKTNVRAPNHTERCFEQAKKIVDTLHEALVHDTSRCCDEHTKVAIIEAKEQLQMTLNEYMEHKMMVNRDREMCKSLTDADAMLVARYAVHHSREQLEGDSRDAHRWAKFICVALAGRINIEKEEHLATMLEPAEWMTRMKTRATTLASEDKGAGQPSANQMRKEQHLQKEEEGIYHEHNVQLLLQFYNSHDPTKATFDHVASLLARFSAKELNAAFMRKYAVSAMLEEQAEQGETERALHEENARLRKELKDLRATLAAGRRTSREGKTSRTLLRRENLLLEEEKTRLQMVAREDRERLPLQISSRSAAAVAAWKNKAARNPRGGRAPSRSQPVIVTAARVSSASSAMSTLHHSDEPGDVSAECHFNIDGTFGDLDATSQMQELVPAEREWVHQEIEKYEQEEAQERQEAHENMVYLMHQQQLQAAEHQLLQDMEQQQYQLQPQGLQGRRAYSV
jgi:hypothetical protein